MGADQTTTVLVRIRIADRPGALGAVTSRIGAVRGDVVSIQILERGDGWVIDELVISLPDADRIELMVREIGADGEAQVEDVEPHHGVPFDPQLDAFEVAALIVGCDDADDLLDALCEHTARAIRTSWVAVVASTPIGDPVVAWSGDAPLDLLTNANPPTPVRPAPDDELWMPLPSAGAWLVLGRSGLAFRARERRRAAALARMADSLHGSIRERRRLRSVAAHPAGGAPAGSLRF